jgi:hypothetical protein
MLLGLRKDPTPTPDRDGAGGWISIGKLMALRHIAMKDFMPPLCGLNRFIVIFL